MSKTIKITNKQLEEAMDVFVNKMGTETPEQALKRTQKEIEYYYSINCLLKNYKTSKYVFEACVRGM
jgi:short-subunit dehydrogenase